MHQNNVRYSYDGMLGRRWSSCRVFSLSAVVSLAICWSGMSVQASSDSTKHWVGTWTCAQYEAGSNTPSSPLSNNTFRQVVRVSIGGDTIRVKFSNITCSKAVTINAVNVAVSPDGTKSAIDAATIKELTFDGKATVTINAKSEVYSDPVAFDLQPSMRVAITTYYAQCQTSSDMTFHYGSRTDSYLLSGDKTTSADFGGATKIERWYTIAGIDVLAPKSSAAVAIIGNSITDGYGLSGGLQNRWTDVFSEALLKNDKTEQVGVLNLGIGATLVTSASNGAKSGVDRFKQDVLSQSGLKWVIIFYGVNDINANVSANNIINGIKSMIAYVRAKDSTIKVYGATITPFNGHSYYSPAHEQIRSSVNEWIRTPGNCDAVLDFDKAIRDPNDMTRMQAALKNDWLHPNAAGYKAIGESIDLKLFEPPQVKIQKTPVHSEIPRTGINMGHFDGTQITFNLPRETFVALNIYSILGREVARLPGRTYPAGDHTVACNEGTLPFGTYLFSIKAGNQTVSDRQTIIHTR